MNLLGLMVYQAIEEVELVMQITKASPIISTITSITLNIILMPIKLTDMMRH
jgi:hypothetical protein